MRPSLSALFVLLAAACDSSPERAEASDFAISTWQDCVRARLLSSAPDGAGELPADELVAHYEACRPADAVASAESFRVVVRGLALLSPDLARVRISFRESAP